MLKLDIETEQALDAVAYLGAPVELYGDLSDKTFSIELLTDAQRVSVTPFAQSGSGNALSPWSEVGATMLPKSSWSCVTLAMALATEPDTFDVTRVTHLGLMFEIELDASQTVRIVGRNAGY
ncbi:MAG: hypothetical protein QM831_22220 [Kofleriaceae bacterium]